MDYFARDNMGHKLKIFIAILRNSFRLFLKNDPLLMSAATAYFTIFALPAILIIIVQVFSLFIDPDTIKHGLFVNLSGIVGKEAVRQVVSVIRAFRKLTHNWAAMIVGFTFLVFVATTVFKVITSSINKIWDVAIDSKRIMNTFQSRLQSLLVILIAGLLLMIGILVETFQVFIGNYFFKILPSFSSAFNQVTAFFISIVMVATWFAIVFRYLPDWRPSWKVTWVGALFTSLLFSIGKIVLHVLLTYNNINTIYGASASIVLLLLFVFYSAMILYYGAAFTKMWAMYNEERTEAKKAQA